MSKFDVEGKYVLIAGGSKGLGLSFALQLVAKGANIIIAARTQSTLDKARDKILEKVKSPSQTVETISIDLCSPEKVDSAIRAHHAIPDILICCAGGTSTQLGFIADIKPVHISSCLESNYYSAAFAAQSVLRLWINSPSPTTTRHMVFTSSTAALVSLPGYGAYTPSKVAVRALADTLRGEVLLYGGPEMYQVHCCFPGTFISDGFIEEQAIKPKLTKILEETDVPESQMAVKFETAESVATKFIKGLERGDNYLTVDFDGALLLNGMRGMSPRDHGFKDFILGWLGNCVLWWVQRGFDKKTTQFGIDEGLAKGKSIPSKL